MIYGGWLLIIYISYTHESLLIKKHVNKKIYAEKGIVRQIR